MRVLYRLRQFWRSLAVDLDLSEVDQAKRWLTPGQMELFERLQPDEKHHALVMLRHLLAQGESQPDLLVAALLHDVGKLRHPLNPIERAMVVVTEAIVPARAREWGRIPPQGFETLPRWRKAFVVAEQHAGWGADLAHISGVSPLTESLIRSHHRPQALQSNGEASQMLLKLWILDNES